MMFNIPKFEPPLCWLFVYIDRKTSCTLDCVFLLNFIDYRHLNIVLLLFVVIAWQHIYFRYTAQWEINILQNCGKFWISISYTFRKMMFPCLWIEQIMADKREINLVYDTKTQQHYYCGFTKTFSLLFVAVAEPSSSPG